MALRSVASLSPDDPDPPTDRHDPELGRRIVLGLVIVVLVLSVTGMLLSLWLRGSERLLGQLGRLLLEYSLGMELYRGHRWARWLTVCLFGAAAAVTSWFLATRSFEPLLLGLVVVHGCSALLLLFHPAVRAHFALHRAS